MSNKQRKSIKSRASPAWKDKLREECFQRLDAARSQLLETARQARTSTNGTYGGVQAALRSIISDSSAHLHTEIQPLLTTPIGHATPAPSTSFPSQPHKGALAPTATAPAAATATNISKTSNTPTTLALADDTLEEASIEPSASTHDFLLSPPKAQQQPPELSQLSPGEYENLMRSLEASLYEDMLREEADYLDSLEKQDIDAMVEAHLGRMALGNGAGRGGEEENENDGDDENNVLCPLCQDAWLIQRNGVILCPRRHLRLDAAIEGLTLKDLRRRLAAVLEEHTTGALVKTDSGGGGGGQCLGRVVFEQAGAPGVNSLVMRCDTCGALEIVM